MKKKIVAFGEVMMRLAPPMYRTLQQAQTFDFMFTGTGVNVLAGLYGLGFETTLLTALPDNNVGYAAASHLRRLGIKDSHISFSGNHLGSYVIEFGAGARSSQVTYLNRTESSFAKTNYQLEYWESVVANADMLHICGISLINENTYNIALTLMDIAKDHHVPVVFDSNFRPSLWQDDRMHLYKEMYEAMLKRADIVFAGPKDVVKLLGIDGDTATLMQVFQKHYALEYVLGTERFEQSIQGFIVSTDAYNVSDRYPLTIIDRIGGGDGFAVGALTGILEGMAPEDIVTYGVASGVLAHTVYGDAVMVNRIDIENLIQGVKIDLKR